MATASRCLLPGKISHFDRLFHGEREKHSGDVSGKISFNLFFAQNYGEKTVYYNEIL